MGKGYLSGAFDVTGMNQATGKYIDKKFISGDYDAKNAARKEQERIDAERTSAADKSLNEIQSRQSKFFGDYGNLMNSYLKSQGQLKSDAQAQATDARRVYQNLSTRQDDVMNRAQSEADQAMTLKELADPNNRVATATRALYDQRANQARQQGQQDFGVLSALGQQATQSTMGSQPMTVGQQMAMASMNQRQAGEAYAQAQRRMQALQDQGLDMGFARTDKVYAAGQDAKDRYRQSMADREGLTQNDIATQRGFRGEIGGYNAENFDLRGGFAREQANFGNQMTQNRLGVQDRSLSAKDFRISQGLADDAAAMAARQQMAAAGLSTAGSIVGGIYGGPMGAQAGSQAGRLVPQGGGAVGIQQGYNTAPQQGYNIAGSFSQPQGSSQFAATPGMAPQAAGPQQGVMPPQQGYAQADPVRLNQARRYLDARGPQPGYAGGYY